MFGSPGRRAGRQGSDAVPGMGVPINLRRWPGWRRWWRFNGVGLAGIGVQLVSLHLLVGVGSVDYRVATVLAVAAAVIHNFAWHRRWTWADRPSGTSAFVLFARFAAANGTASLVGNVAIVSALVGLIDMPVMPANIVAIAVCGLLNFWIADVVVFRPDPATPSPAVRGR